MPCIRIFAPIYCEKKKRVELHMLLFMPGTECGRHFAEISPDECDFQLNGKNMRYLIWKHQKCTTTNNSGLRGEDHKKETRIYLQSVDLRRNYSEVYK